MPRGGKRDGAGRKKGSSEGKTPSSQVVRVPVGISAEEYQNLRDLLTLIDSWEDELAEAKGRGESTRTYDKLALLLDEVRELGFRRL